jgi:AraC family L-rhamnose operon regulatory protein RhaS
VAHSGYPPIYTDPAGRFRADACLPLNEAVARGEVALHALARGHYPGARLGRSDLPGLKTVGFWDAPLAQGWGLDWHRNEGIEITFCEEGRLGFAVDDFACTLRDGDLTVTRPWQLHRVGDPHVAAGRLHWVILDVGVRRPNQPWRWPRWLVLQHADLDELAAMLRCQERCVWPAAELRGCFQRIADAIVSETPARAISRVGVAVNELLLLLLDLVRDTHEPSDAQLSDTRRAVQLFLQDMATNDAAFSREWSVDEMAASCGIGKTQFLKYCRQLTHMAPASYLRQCRLEAAARLLRDAPHATITEIALGCGFASSQYFATVFLKRFGCSPGDYRHAAANPRP